MPENRLLSPIAVERLSESGPVTFLRRICPAISSKNRRAASEAESKCRTMSVRPSVSFCRHSRALSAASSCDFLSFSLASFRS